MKRNMKYYCGSLALLLFLVGCSADRTDNEALVPLHTTEAPEPATKVQTPTTEVMAETIEEEVLALDTQHQIDFMTAEDEIGAYHDVIEVVYIEDEDVIEALYKDERLKPLRAHLSQFNYNTAPGQIGLVTTPESIFAISSKLNKLPEDFEPKDLRDVNIDFSFSGPDMKRQLRDEAATALEALVAASLEEGLDVRGVSGYRSYSRQNSIYSYNVKTRGVEETDEVSARPGHSEHQTGLAMDVSTAAVGFTLEESFGETAEGMWISDNAHEYGFVIRYPEAYISNTGYNYEPWHLRYVGQGLASFTYEYDLTLEMIYATLLKRQ